MKTTPKIKAGPGIRYLFFGFTAILLVTVLLVGLNEKKRKETWTSWQEAYRSTYARMLSEQIGKDEADGKGEEAETLKQLLEVTLSSAPSMNVVFLPEAGSRDLCMTCHMGMENPMFKEEPHPLKTHPAGILKDHSISHFGCTLCHHGQGVGLTAKKAHGFEHNWESPRLPMAYVQSTCFECHENVYGLAGAEKGAEGKKLFVEKGCYGCHEARVQKDLPEFSTPFNGIPQKISGKGWLTAWIKDPKSIRPATLMPTFRLTDAQRAYVSSFLFSIDDDVLKARLANGVKGSVKKGREVFVQKACVACHSEKAEETGQTRRVPQLADAGLKLNKNWLVPWLTDPMSVNDRTWMPKLELTEGDIRDLTAYLETLKREEVKTLLPEKVLDGDIASGKGLAQSLGCLGCHRINGRETPAKVGVSVADVADKRMEELPFGTSDVPYTKWDWIKNKIKRPDIYKTEDMPMAMPDFDVTDGEVENLTVFYLFNRMKDLPENYLVREDSETARDEKGTFLLTHFNCRGCHTVLPGETPRIDAFLDKKTMVPPRIVDEVEKVQPGWLYNYLNRPFAMRPWLSIRMPAFNLSYAHKTMLINQMHALMPGEKRENNKIPFDTALSRADYDKETLDMGEYRFRNDKCMQCHPVNFTGKVPEGKKLEDLSIDLMLAKNRLRFEWLKNFLRNPDQYAGAGTRMPFVFYTPDKVPRIPDPEDWISRTALFMMFMEKVPKPLQVEETKREVQTFDFENY